jgi:hypothetical protein
MFVIPSTAVVAMCVWRLEWTVYFAMSVGLVALPAFGGLMTAAMAPAAFGDRFSVSHGWKNLGRTGRRRYILRTLYIAGGIVLMGTPGWFHGTVHIGIALIPLGLYWAATSGFGIDQAALADLSRNTSDRRLRDLLKGESSELVIRGIILGAYCLVFAAAVFAVLDLAGSIFGIPVLFGRLVGDSTVDDISPEQAMPYFFSLLYNDPVCVTALYLSACIVFPVMRAAWFLSYLDLRVRRDCWDIALQVELEARRLESPA